MESKKIISIIEWAVRINVFLKLCNYGIGKIMNGQFYLKDSIPEAIASTPLSEVGSYDLAWTFFGHSKSYILFIGISQIVGALLFLLPKTKLLGGFILIPILLNIIAVDYFFGVAYGALFSACFYLVSILWVLYLGKNQVFDAIKKLLPVRKREFLPLKGKIWTVLGVLSILGILFVIEFWGIGYFGYEDR
jgi:hypothetical protein|tara:strand:- start:71539 stop:72111 length:573 start_codon:yes stop_codon:yes gene_type:complete